MSIGGRAGRTFLGRFLAILEGICRVQFEQFLGTWRGWASWMERAGDAGDVGCWVLGW